VAVMPVKRYPSTFSSRTTKFMKDNTRN